MAISGIFTALSGMNAHRRVLDTTAHNVANQLTPGYRRQVVDLAPASVGSGPQVFAGPGSQLNGVDAIDTRRVLDQMAEGRARTSVATAVDATTMHSAMVQLEDVFGEPGPRGISTQLDEFHTSWSDLADRADDTVARNEVLAQAEGVIQRFSQVDSDLTQISRDISERLGTMAAEVNTIASQVADLNRTIAASPQTPNGLLDERDLLAAKLSTLTGAEVRPSTNNQVTVSLGGRARRRRRHRLPGRTGSHRPRLGDRQLPRRRRPQRTRCRQPTARDHDPRPPQRLRCDGRQLRG